MVKISSLQLNGVASARHSDEAPISIPCAPSTEFVAPSATSPDRVRVLGKFFHLVATKLYIKGATYGPFRPEPDGSEYRTPDVVGRDFAQMAAAGINSVRTYTVP